MASTAYELGTAFGTAILGSVLLGFYRAGLMESAPSGLPAEILESAKETLATALLYAQEISGEVGAALAKAATESFTTALAWTGGIAEGDLPERPGRQRLIPHVSVHATEGLVARSPSL